VKAAFAFLRRFAVTTVAVMAAFVFGSYLWIYYMDEPWTRDGRVRADVVDVAPDVSGFVTEVMVRDNQQVRRGDGLFRIDRARFALALQQADAVVAGRRASLDQAESDLNRYRALTTLAVTQQKQEQVLATEQQAKAAYDQAVADRAVAQLNLDRSEVHASVNGKISNMDLRPGAYVTAGKGVMALVDTDTLHVEGYFEETKLPRIHVGDRVAIHLMGNAARLTGHVESIAAGIEDRDRGAGASMLADVNPTFSWVRLAQRVPVRISLDGIPADGTFVTGRTATVEVLSQQPIGLARLFGVAGSPTLHFSMRDRCGSFEPCP
jgi:multidrug resistance efflux pump